MASYKMQTSPHIIVLRVALESKFFYFFRSSRVFADKKDFRVTYQRP